MCGRQLRFHSHLPLPLRRAAPCHRTGVNNCDRFSLSLLALTRLQGLCSTAVDDTVGPLPIIAGVSWIGFIGGGNSNVTSSSASNSAAAAAACACCELLGPMLVDVDGVDLDAADDDDAVTVGSSSVVIVDSFSLGVANLNVFSEPFFTNGLSAAAVLSTFP